MKPGKLLIGTWRSDRRLTLQNCHRYHQLTGARKREFGSLFGRLLLRYSSGRLYVSLGPQNWTARYDVVAEDAESLVLRIHSDDLWKRADPLVAGILKQLAEPRLQHLHFHTRDGHPYYWIGCGAFCEWFKRVDVASTGGRGRGVSRAPAAK